MSSSPYRCDSWQWSHTARSSCSRYRTYYPILRLLLRATWHRQHGRSDRLTQYRRPWLCIRGYPRSPRSRHFRDSDACPQATPSNMPITMPHPPIMISVAVGSIGAAAQPPKSSITPIRCILCSIPRMTPPIPGAIMASSDIEPDGPLPRAAGSCTIPSIASIEPTQ